MAGSSQYWHSRMRRNERRRRRKRTKPEGKRFSWPVTLVTVLLSLLNSYLAEVMIVSLGQFTPCFTCKDSLCLVLQSQK